VVLDEFQSSSTVQEWPNCRVGFPVGLDGVGGTDADPAVTPCPDVCALKRQLLDHPEISSNRHAALPDPNVRDRAGGAVVVIDLPVEATAMGLASWIRRRSSRAACRHAAGLPDASRDGCLWLRSGFVSGRAG
jgi:hypothetical protein